MNSQKKYDGIDFLRVIACFCIIMMHILKNNTYSMNNQIFIKVVSEFTDFTLLFMTLSSFGLCMGYYDRMISGCVDLKQFYLRRYSKILPFYSNSLFYYCK